MISLSLPFFSPPLSLFLTPSLPFSLSQCSGVPLTLPPKTLLTKTDRQFVAERQQGLETFLSTILAHPVLSNHMTVKKFLDPKNYSSGKATMM